MNEKPSVWRILLTTRFVLAGMGLVLLSLALCWLGLQYVDSDRNIILPCVALLTLPVAYLWMRSQLRDQLALFRALNGAVISYQDGDYSFGLHWSRNDELAELVAAHNELGNTLREQRLNLVQRELLLDSMVQNTPVAMLLVADQGAVVFANIAARQLLNQGRKLEGLRLNDILSHVSHSLQEAVQKGGDGLFTVKHTVDDILNDHDHDHDEEDVYHLAQRVFTLNGREHHLFLLRHLTAELRRQEVQTWKKVIRVISHELNNSLAPIASLAHSAQVLIQKEKMERLPEILATIEERTRHLEDFIHGYARFAKLPAPQCTEVAWTQFIPSLQSHIPFQLTENLPDDVVRIDRPQIEQAILNLLKNAHESGSPATGVSLSVKRIIDGWRIAIADQGSGMTETVMANALVPFYSTKRSGTGLGLALAREIVEAHGGRISLNNRPEGGLMVSLILPG